MSNKSVKSLTDLPSEIIVEILARLPLRTLFVSRSVCKTFLVLTTNNPHFIDFHSSVQVFQFGGCSNPSFLLHLADPELDYAPKNSHLKPFFHLPKIGVNASNSLGEECRFYLVNSCNGLVYFLRNMLDGDDRSVVCNPVTNEYIVIPGVDSKIGLDPPTRGMWLGFSPCTNQYKVLRMSCSVNVDHVETTVQVFVIGPNSWRDIDATQQWKYPLYWNLSPTFVNGLMYWHRHGWTDLVSFDFEREKFGEVALPPEFQKEQFRNLYYSSIGVLGDCLCLSCNDFDDQLVYLWVMRKSENQDSWRKVFVIDTVRPSCGPVKGQFQPLQLLRNGEILMLWLAIDLVCYDPRTKTLRYFGLNGFKLAVKTVALTPSFVPLKDTLKVEKVMKGYVRPRGDENELSHFTKIVDRPPFQNPFPDSTVMDR